MLGVKSHMDFVRYCINEQQCVPAIKSWDALFLFMQQQALVGIGFSGLERLKAAEVEVPRDIVLQWYAMSEQIRQRNVEMNKKCVELTEMLRKDGFHSCILKGQGNALLYDVRCERGEGRSMSFLRQPGDIDLLVDGDKKNIIKYVKQRYPQAKVAYQHIDYPVFKDVEVELHYLPTYLNNPIYNLRLKKWYKTQTDIFSNYVELPDGQGEIPVPTGDFNVVFQLAHMMHHFFDEGIGLRQMIDYYFLLKSGNNNQVQGSRFKDYGQLTVQGSRFKVYGSIESLEETLKYLNLYNFAGAVMYIMKEVLGLEEQYLIVPVDDKRGETLLKEILRGGNFGKYSGLDQNNAAKKYFQKTWRNMQLVKEYPAEALCEPFFRTWHFFWRVMHS